MNRTFAILIAASALLAAGCAGTTTRESTGQYIDDSSITTRVINVETYKSVVQLSGFVDSTAQVGTAATVARSVEGVASVKNDLRVKY